MIAFAAIGFTTSADAQTVVRERTVVRHHHVNNMAPVSVTVRTHPRGHGYGYYRNREFYGYRRDHFRRHHFHGPVTTTRRTVIYR